MFITHCRWMYMYQSIGKYPKAEACSPFYGNFLDTSETKTSNIFQYVASDIFMFRSILHLLPDLVCGDLFHLVC